MKKKELKERHWEDKKTRKSLDLIEEKVKQMMAIKQEIKKEITSLERKAKREENYSFLDDLEEATYSISYIEEEIQSLLGILRESNALEAGNLLATLEKNIGELV